MRHCPENIPLSLSSPSLRPTELAKATGVEKSLVLVMTSGLVNRKNFMDALNSRLAPPMTKARQGAALEAFQRQFDGVNIKKGMQLSFTFVGSKLVTKADGVEIGTIANKALVATLLESYLGRDPVSKGAKESFAEGLARMVLA